MVGSVRTFISRCGCVNVRWNPLWTRWGERDTPEHTQYIYVAMLCFVSSCFVCVYVSMLRVVANRAAHMLPTIDASNCHDDISYQLIDVLPTSIRAFEQASISRHVAYNYHDRWRKLSVAPGTSPPSSTSSSSLWSHHIFALRDRRRCDRVSFCFLPPLLRQVCPVSVFVFAILQ